MALRIGIKCKNTPDRFAPIIDIPLIHNINEARPGIEQRTIKLK